MIATQKPKMIVDSKLELIAASKKFAAGFENPDFVILLEAIKTFEKILKF